MLFHACAHNPTGVDLKVQSSCHSFLCPCEGITCVVIMSSLCLSYPLLSSGCPLSLPTLPSLLSFLLSSPLSCFYSPFFQLDQWAEVSRICREKNHFVVVDMAYQGFATGDLDRDAAGLRLLAKDGHKLMLCQSFSKNMGLYGE